MVDLVIAAASVQSSGSNAVLDSGRASAAIAAGQVVYRDATSLQWGVADSNAVVAGSNTANGIALNSAAAGQPVNVQRSGDIAIGATLVPGTAYYLSANAGGICPLADVITGDNVCLLGLAVSASVLRLGIETPGVIHA